MSVWVLNYAKTAFVNPLNRAVREDALFTTVGIKTLDSSIWEINLLGPIRKMLLDLFVLKLKYLKSVRVRSLGGSSFSKEVNCLPFAKCLLDVLVSEPNNLISIRPNFTLDTICKHNLFLAV